MTVRGLSLILGLVLCAAGDESAWLTDQQVIQIPSPDRRWVLIVSPISEHAHALDLKDAGSGRETRVMVYDRGLRVEWSPDSKAFYMNDAYGSNQEDAYVYWIDRRKAMLLSDLILNKDPEARKLGADHQYFHAYRWVDASTVEVEYCGHTTGALFVQFDFLYRVGLGRAAADIVRLSGKTRRVTFSEQECQY
jgi:hypothetical protein